MIKDISDNLGAALAKRKEDEFREVIDAFLAPGWSMEDVKRRCQIVRYANKLVETLCIDGKPVLEIHPLEFEQAKTETGWTIRATQKYRKLTV